MVSLFVCFFFPFNACAVSTIVVGTIVRKMNRLYDDDDDDDDDGDGMDGRDAKRKKGAEAKEEPFEKTKRHSLEQCCEMRGVKWMMMMVCSRKKKKCSLSGLVICLFVPALSLCGPAIGRN